MDSKDPETHAVIGAVMDAFHFHQMRRGSLRFRRFHRLFGLSGPSSVSSQAKSQYCKKTPVSSSLNLWNLRNLWQKKLPGFTLLELLVAMAVMTLLVVMLMGLVDGAAKLWRTNENRVESYREARAALNLIASELRTIHASTNSNFFNLQTNSADADSTLAFLTALPLDAQSSTNKSDLCAVAFFLSEGPVSDIGPESRTTTWNLYRYLRESNDTFTALTNNPASPDLWPPNFRPEDGEILARNIRSLQIRAFTQNGTSWQTWTQSAAKPMPDLVEIEIEAVNTELAKRLDGDLKQDREDIAAETRRWVTRIPIRQPAQ
jgi:prepilin-type N-terminal cleavage/methylation domain-containing protein